MQKKKLTKAQRREILIANLKKARAARGKNVAAQKMAAKREKGAPPTIAPESRAEAGNGTNAILALRLAIRTYVATLQKEGHGLELLIGTDLDKGLRKVAEKARQRRAQQIAQAEQFLRAVSE